MLQPGRLAFRKGSRDFLNRNVFFLLVITFFVFTLIEAGFLPAESAAEGTPGKEGKGALSLVFMLDSSGSMRQNDPGGLRKAAAQAVVTMLNPDDEVAVMDFDDAGRILSEGKGTPWVRADQRDKLEAAFQKVGDRGNFTDFRAALQDVIPVFEKTPANRRKIVLLLSDGILEPNPLDPTYTPHQYSYRIAIARAGRERRKEINEEYRQKLSPIARRILAEEVMPALRRMEVEVFTVGLGPQADRVLLQDFAAETTRNPLELHSFNAEKATDLVGVFSRLLQYWTDMTVLHIAEGDIRPGNMRTMFLDEYVQAPLVISAEDDEGEFIVRSQDDRQEEGIPLLHRSLQEYPLTKGTTPGTWTYGFRDGRGRYRVIWIARNRLLLEVKGLKGRYSFGETVEAEVSLQVQEEGRAVPFVTPGSRIFAELVPDRERSGVVRIELKPEGTRYTFRFSPPRGGEYTVDFTSHPKDRQGRDILPRPSRKYRFEVSRGLQVTPQRLNFGKGKGKKELRQTIEVRSGLDVPVDVALSGKVLQSSSRSFREGAKERIPSIGNARFGIGPGEAKKMDVALFLPAKVGWGDYEGEVVLLAGAGESYAIPFRVHVPSLWERVRLPMFFALVLLISLLSYLAYIWGILGSPVGVLVPVSTPQGVLLAPIKLGRVKRGLLSKWLNWRRNLLRIGSEKTEVRLAGLPAGLLVELAFYRPGKAYVRNRSPKGPTMSIHIEEPGIGRLERKPGQRYSFRHDCILEMGGYKFRYEKH